MSVDWSKPIEIVDGDRLIPATLMHSEGRHAVCHHISTDRSSYWANEDGTIPATDLIVRNVQPVTDYVAALHEIIEGVKEVEAVLAHDGAGYFSLIRQWALDRNLVEGSTPDKQMLKLVEEFGELGGAMARGRRTATMDAIGDMIVVLTILSAQHGFTIEECIAQAWEEIKDRRGRMIDKEGDAA